MKDLDTIVSKMGKRFNPDSYVVCQDINGRIVFVPLKSSRHSHTIIVSEIEEASKAVEWARKKGFTVVENCIAMPETS